MPRVIARAPMSLRADPVVASLGSVLEVETRAGEVLRWPRGQVELLWHPPSSTLLWFDCEPESIDTDEQPPARRAIAAFERFKDRDAKRMRAERYAVAGPWQTWGPCVRIDYHSDKWSEKASYTHALGKSVSMYRQGNKNGPWLFALRGGSITVTRRGIVG